MIGNKIKGIGEIVLRVEDLNKMKRFYSDVIGLKLMRESKNYVFYNIADGHDGHTQIIALFDKSITSSFDEKLGEVNANNSSLHHFAFEIDKLDYKVVLLHLQNMNVSYVTKEFEWVSWRSIFLMDPEGNSFEFVCYDSSINL